VEVPAADSVVKSRFNEPTRVYIDCYDRYFHVGHISKNGFTYSLDQEELYTIMGHFEKHNIPHIISAASKIDQAKCVMEACPDEPSKSYKVVFTVPDSEQIYAVANYNSCNIIHKYATGILRAFLAKGIKAALDIAHKKIDRVVLHPNAPSLKTEKTNIYPQIIQKEEAKPMNNSKVLHDAHVKSKKLEGQISIFDLMNTS
jgi:hypothetical protein